MPTLLAGAEQAARAQDHHPAQRHALARAGRPGHLCAGRTRAQARRIAVEENGARYFADLGQGQKTGWYYDQRDNRAFMAALAKGKTVLDAYSYTGGFGILAAKAGAKEVICLDSSAPALALAEESARGQSACRSRPSRPMCSRNWNGCGAQSETIRHRHRRSAALREIAERIWSRAPRPIASWRGWPPTSPRRAACCCWRPARTIFRPERFAAECAAGIAARPAARASADPPAPAPARIIRCIRCCRKRRI